MNNSNIHAPFSDNNFEMVEIDTSKLDVNIESNDITKCIMSTEEIKFIIHLLREYKPRKILEIGSAHGGSAYHLIKNMPEGAHLYCVDISENLFGNPDAKETGYIVKELCSNEERANVTTYFGNDIVECIDKIGDGIDFVLLDTVHYLPGEFLSYLITLPYLKNNAVLVLHDIHDNYIHIMNDDYSGGRNRYCNTLLFTSIMSPLKYVLTEDNISSYYGTMEITPISNIGALIVTEMTKKSVINIFHTLFVQWDYFPDKRIDLNKYEEFIENHYSKDCLTYFNKCIEQQRRYFEYYNNNLIYRLNSILQRKFEWYYPKLKNIFK